MSLTGKEMYEFGPFSLDPAERLILRDGEPLSLTPKVFDTLLCLVRNPGRLLTKDELLNQIWPATFVEEVNLAVNISTLRKVLGESPQDVRYIATVPGLGYRFVAEVKLIQRQSKGERNPTLNDRLEMEPGQQPSGSSEIDLDTRDRFAFATHVWLRKLAAPLGYMLAALLLAFVAFTTKGRAWRELHLGTADPQIRSIVVLPLASLSHDPEQEYFADGMTEALIDNLSQISSLRVISRTSAMHYKGTKKTLPEIANELNVDGVVEGSVMRSGNQVRITAQLLQARRDQHVWGGTYDRELGDVLKLQSDVAQAIAGQVRAQLTPQQHAKLNSAPAVDAAAFEMYLKGRFAFKKFSGPDIRMAQSSYQEAIRLDPQFTLAYVGLADSYRTLGDFRALPPQEANNNAKKAIQKALELDPTLGEAHTTLGTLSWRYDWDWATAEREFRRSLELNPNYASGHLYLAIFLGWKGNRSEALGELAKARDLDPFCPGDEIIYYHLRDYQPMMEAGLRDVASNNPDHWLRHYFLAVAYEGLGKVEAAIPEYQKAVELSAGDTDATAALAHAYAVSGQKNRAEKILRDTLRQSKDSYVSPYLIATIYAALGDKNSAFELLQKAYDERSSDLPYFVSADLRIDSLRSDPRFAELLKKMKLPA